MDCAAGGSNLGALGLRRFGEQPSGPALGVGARRGARRALLCGPEWESRARL